MKTVLNFILLTFIFVASLSAQDTEEGTGKRRSLFEVIRKDNSLFKKVPQLPKSNEEGLFSSLRTSLFLGKRFGRQDLTNLDKTTESYYNDDGTSFALGLDYYFLPWMSFSYQFQINKQERRRYDGFQVNRNRDKTLLNHDVSLGLDYGNLFLKFFYFQASRILPLQNQINELYSVNQGVFGTTVGSRIFLSNPIAIDLFYSYGISQSLKSSGFSQFEDSRFSRIGARIYWAAKMHFGIELYEEATKAVIAGLDIREKNFSILPYWRF